MIVPLLVVFLGVFQESVKTVTGASWSYEGAHGPSHWPSLFFTCSGSRQSPINIETGSVKKEYWGALKFKNYDAAPIRARVKNNGHTAVVEMDGENAPRVSGGGLKDEYVFAQFHFHWGIDSTQGSEHTVDGVRYPLELHLVHYKASYGSLIESVKHPDGLAVLGILFEVGQTDNPAFSSIVASLPAIRDPETVQDIVNPNPLGAFLPGDKSMFFRYLGSLTTPTCNEVVIWTVFRSPVSISEAQLREFRALLDTDNKPLINNYRQPQQLRSRRVYLNIAKSGEDSLSMKKLGIAMYFMSSMAVLMMNM